MEVLLYAVLLGQLSGTGLGALRFRKNSDDQKNTSKTSQTANTQTNQTPPSRATNKQTAGRANQNKPNNSHKTKTTTEHRVHLGD